MKRNGFTPIKSGFTLVELLVVMAIIGILVTLVASNFRNTQLRGRDAQRKSDLRNIMNSLELFFSDYGRYPPGDGAGGIMACPYDPSGGIGLLCKWGTGQSFTDEKTVYFKLLPSDPVSNQNYYYRVVDSPTNQKVQLFARLENTKDPECLGGNCLVSPVTYPCGSAGSICNFAITSPNTIPTE